MYPDEIPDDEAQRRQQRRKLNDLKRKAAQDQGKTTTPVSPRKKSRWRRVVWGVKMVALLLVFTSVGMCSFLVGRFSSYPHIRPFVPQRSIPTPVPEAPPEEIVLTYFEIAKHQDADRVLPLFHPEFIKRDGGDIVRETQQISHMTPRLREIKILTVDHEETATVIVNITSTGGHIETGRFQLKKLDGQWRIYNVGL